MRTVNLRIVLATVVTALAIAACTPSPGGGGSTTPSTPTSTTTTTVPGGDPPTALGGTPSDFSAYSTTFSNETTSTPSADLTAYEVPASNQVSPDGLQKVSSCTAWAVGYALLGWYANHQHWQPRPPFAPMYLYSQIHSIVANTAVDNGSSIGVAMRVLQTQGIDTEAEYDQGDYDWKDQPTAAERSDAARTKITGYSPVYAGVGLAEDPIKVALAAGKPVAVGFVPEDGFWGLFTNHSANPIDNDIAVGTKNPTGIGHAVLALGYDSTGLWIQNSWGSNWGNNGFGRLSWNVVNHDVTEAWTIDGLIAGQPAAGPGPARNLSSVAPGPGATSLYRTDAAGQTWGQYYSPLSQQWSGWFSLGADAKFPGSDITALPDGTGAVDVFAQGADGRIWRGHHVPGKDNGNFLGSPREVNQWSGWGATDGDVAFPPGSKITALSARTGESTLYVQGSDGRIWSQYRLAGHTAWSGWFNIGTRSFASGSNLTAVSPRSGESSLYILDGTGQVWQDYFAAGGATWSGWFPVSTPPLIPPSGFISQSVTALSARPGETSLYAVALDGRVYTNYFAAGATSWSGWIQLGSNTFPIGSTVTAGSTGPGETSLYIVGLDHQVWTQFFDPTHATTWSGWLGLGGVSIPTGQPVGAFSNAPGATTLHVIGADGSDQTEYFPAGGTAWSGWYTV